VVLGAIGGCARPAEESAPEAAVESWFEEGPVRVHVRLDQIEIDTVGSVTLDIETDSDPRFVVEGAKIGDSLGGLTVRDRIERGPTLGADGRVHRSTRLMLEPYLPGEYEIPELVFSYESIEGEGGNGGDGGGQAGEVRTGALRVDVVSVLGDGALSLGEMRDVVDPVRKVEIPVGGIVIASVIAIGLVVAIVVVGRRLQLDPPAVSPVSASRERLEVLQRRPLEDEPERSETLHEASELVRLCIAHRAEPGAAQMSQRELSRAMRDWIGIDTSERLALGGMLRRLDEALYGGSIPDADETRELVKDAREHLAIIDRVGVHFAAAAQLEQEIEQEIKEEDRAS